MKTLLLIASIALVSSPLFAAVDEDRIVVGGAASRDIGDSPFHARELQIDVFGASQSADGDRIDHVRARAGFGFSFFPVRNFGLGLEVSTPSLGQGFLEDIAWHGIARFPMGNVAPYALGGVSYNTDDAHDLHAHAGAGLEWRLTRRFGIFGDSRFVSDLDGESHLLSRAGLRFAW